MHQVYYIHLAVLGEIETGAVARPSVACTAAGVRPAAMRYTTWLVLLKPHLYLKTHSQHSLYPQARHFWQPST